MPKTLIESFPAQKRVAASDGSPILNIAECFMDTIQGENFVGVPSTFLRLQYCTIKCEWCDTLEVWRKGNQYSVKELINIFHINGTIEKFRKGQHLILTGGSPVLQQDALLELLKSIYSTYGFVPTVQIENECTRMPREEFAFYISTWNNSPKTANSGVRKELRYKPDIIQYLSKKPNSYFKFVISKLDDWKEIDLDYLAPGLIHRNQIVLMPEGQNRQEIQNHYETVVELAVRENVRMCDRMHISIWNQTVGV